MGADDLSKVWLIGENNPYHTDPKFDLYPLPKRSAGHRLCTLILGMRPRHYIRLRRRNLLRGAWGAKAAREAAKLLAFEFKHGHTVILLGSKVNAAFSGSAKDWPKALGTILVSHPEAHRIVNVPHPSGLCRFWSPYTIDLTRSVLRECVPALAPFIGELDKLRT